MKDEVLSGIFVGIIISIAVWAIYCIWIAEMKRNRAELKHEIKYEIMKIIHDEIEEKK
jgi:hypothetical protein